MHGALKVVSHTDPQESLFTYRPWWLWLGDCWQSPELRDYQRHGDYWLVKLVDVVQREAAQTLRGRDIWVERCCFKPPSTDEFYWVDIIGSRVENMAGVEFGEVVDVLLTGANPVLVVQRGNTQQLIPWIRDEVIHKIDLPCQRLLIDWQLDY